jgi:hypothetical protein
VNPRSILAAALAATALAAPAQAQEAAITVDASKPLRPISPLLFGLNHRFGFDGYDNPQTSTCASSSRSAGPRRSS